MTFINKRLPHVYIIDADAYSRIEVLDCFGTAVLRRIATPIGDAPSSEEFSLISYEEMQRLRDCLISILDRARRDKEDRVPA